jgi:hypothetical protein
VVSEDRFHHAFLMILEGDYFVIYDAWSGVRRKWVRALKKDQAIEILDKINDKNSELRRDLFAYFFAPKVTNFGNTTNFSSTWYIVYIPLESELFRDAFERSNGEMLFHGGKSRRKRISKRNNRFNNKLKVNRKYNVSKKCR